MPEIAEELKTYLKTKTTITDLVGAGVACRIYTDRAKQSRTDKPIAPPFIVFEVNSDTSVECLGSIAGIASSRIQIDCFGATSAEAYQTAEAVRLAPLQMFRGLMGTTAVHNVTSDDGYDRGIDAPVKGGNQRRYWFSRDYFLTHDEPVSA